MLTGPVAFDSLQRERIIESARRGGFREVEVIDEPVAAARHWLSSQPQEKYPEIVVCDIGGGTTDIALLRNVDGGFEPIPDVPPRGFQKGGNDIDDLIFSELFAGEDDDSPARHVAGFRVRVQRAKERLSRDQRGAVNLTFDDQQMTLERSRVESCSARFVDDVVAELKRFQQSMKSAGVADVPLLLVGGGLHILGLRERLSKEWNGVVITWKDSEYATVLGAAQSVIPTPVHKGAPTKTTARHPKPYDPSIIPW